MKKIYLLVAVMTSTLFAQASINELRKLNNEQELRKLNNEQLDLIRKELTKSQTEISSDSTQYSLPEPVEIIPESPVEIIPESNNNSKFFGYNYFDNEINFFDNIPTPANYILGPGDQITINLWGETNKRESFTINKEGMIYYKNIGLINLSSKTVDEANELLTKSLSPIYSTLSNNNTNLMVEVGKLKSINVFFTGYIKRPGIHLIHPFSDVFSAIVQAGGVETGGSLRKIQLLRYGQIVAEVDFYSFFMGGSNAFSNIKLIDGDTIHIPSFENRISISGEVNRPSVYELLSNESISDLIGYASGFTGTASSTLILDQIIPAEERFSDDNARTSIALDFKNFKSKSLNNGDKIKVLPISDVEVNVELLGRVKSPGLYPANRDVSLKSILDIAGGFDDPIFRQTILENEILILRQDSNQFYALEIKTSYKDADKQQLMPNDKILVYENTNYRNNPTYRVEGEVRKPGTFPFRPGITVMEALEKAGGISEFGALDNIIVYQEFTSVGKNDIEITELKDVSISSLNLELGVNSVIRALPLENTINVSGNVFNPGLIAYKKNISLKKAITLAGGYKPNSLKKRTYIRKANGEITSIGSFGGRFMRLSPGDTVVVPVNPNPSDFDITAFIADISSTLANIAAILIIVENQNN